MLQGKDVASYYGDVKVLWNISFSIEKGEIVALLGSNGAGKTSLLNTISGILPAKEGSIIFQGKDITKMKPNKIVELGLVQVPEGRKLFPFMTVLENLEIGAYTKRAREKKNEVLSWVYELFPVLRERSHQTAMTLSGGEQQMLAIGRALMSSPTLLMLDEPSLGLAPIVMRSLYNVLPQINKEGVTIFLADQNVEAALDVARRAYILEVGRMVLEGPSESLRNDERVKRAYLGYGRVERRS